MKRSVIGACGDAALMRRMGVDDAGRGVEAWIGDAPDPHASVVVRHVLQQPLDGVVGIGAFVDVGCCSSACRCADASRRNRLRRGNGRARPGTRRCTPPVEGLGRPQARPELIDAVWRDAVRRPRHQEGVASRRILRHVDRREQPLAVPHGDVRLVLGVVRLNIEWRGRLRARNAREHGRGETGHRQRNPRLPAHPPAPRRSASASNVNASSLIDPISGSSSVVTTTMPPSVTVWRRRSSSML